MEEIHLSNRVYRRRASDISDYKRILSAAKDAYKQQKTLVMSGELKVHRPLVLDDTIDNPQGTKLARSIRGTGGHWGGPDPDPQTGNSGRSRNGFCRITAIEDPSYTWGCQDAVLKIVRSNAGHWAHIEKLTVDANRIANYGMVLYHLIGTFRDLKAANAIRGGMVIEACQRSHFDNISGDSNGGFGILMIKCAEAHFTDVKTNDNSGDGLVITSDGETKHKSQRIGDKPIDIRSGDIWISGVSSNNNGPEGKGVFSPQRGHAIALYLLSGGAHINGGHIEKNQGDAIYIENSQNSVVTNLRILPGLVTKGYSPRWLRVQGNGTWGNLIEHNAIEIHLDAGTGWELGVQQVIPVDCPDIWSNAKSRSFHGQNHLMVKFQNEQGEQPSYKLLFPLTTVTFKDNAGADIAYGHLLHILPDPDQCGAGALQLARLWREVIGAGGTPYEQLMENPFGKDVLANAATVHTGSWSAELVPVEGRILVTKNQLNWNFYKHNWRHDSSITSKDPRNLQDYIIQDEGVDGRVLQEQL